MCRSRASLAAAADSQQARTAAARLSTLAKLRSTKLLPSHAKALAPDGNPYLGCQHYKRTCKVRAECCGVFVSCRLCHDEAFESSDGHVCDRHAIKTVLCMRCNEEQPVGQDCVKCKERFADYFCEHCRLYAGSESPIYHCDKCGLCRRGTREGNIHCEDCDACMLKSHAEKHVCMESSMTGDCPVCCSALFTSTRPCVYLACGHSMHQDCYHALIKQDYRCCLCFKALADMSDYYDGIARMLQMEDPLPVELASRRSEIVCNDCSQRSIAPWHFEYHRCQNEIVGEGVETKRCGSFNTRVLHVFEAGCETGRGSASPGTAVR